MCSLSKLAHNVEVRRQAGQPSVRSGADQIEQGRQAEEDECRFLFWLRVCDSSRSFSLVQRDGGGYDFNAANGNGDSGLSGHHWLECGRAEEGCNSDNRSLKV